MYTKNMLMLVVLSAGMFTALTATMISQAAPAFADTEDCEDNNNDNCNDNRNQYVEQENNCEIENEIEDLDNSNNNENNPGAQTLNCQNFGAGRDGIPVDEG
jgi:hypothetical protein